jgi:hypothetical protein
LCYPRNIGEQATAAAHANTIMRRAVIPAPATSPAKYPNSGCDTIACVAAFTAISAAATVAAAKAVFCSNNSVPQNP